MQINAQILSCLKRAKSRLPSPQWNQSPEVEMSLHGYSCGEQKRQNIKIEFKRNLVDCLRPSQISLCNEIVGPDELLAIPQLTGKKNGIFLDPKVAQLLHLGLLIAAICEKWARSLPERRAV